MFLGNLVKNNTGVSSKNFFLVSITIIGLILLFIPAIILLVEIFTRHTIQTDLNGLAAYITAVAAIFASAGITKAWSERYENRRYDHDTNDHDPGYYGDSNNDETKVNDKENK